MRLFPIWALVVGVAMAATAGPAGAEELLSSTDRSWPGGSPAYAGVLRADDPAPPAPPPPPPADGAPVTLPAPSPTVIYRRAPTVAPIDTGLTTPCEVPAPAPAPCERWELMVAAMLVWGDDPQGVFGEPVAWYAPGPGLPPQLTWDDHAYGEEIGARASLRYAVSPGNWLEVRGAWYGSFGQTVRQTGSFGFSPGPAGVGGVSAVASVDLKMEADLYGADLAWWMQVGAGSQTRFDFGVGARWIHFEETATASGWTVPPIGAFTSPALANSKVTHEFVGLQVGGAVHFDLNSCWTLTAALRAMAGNMNRNLDVTDRSFFAGGSHAASSERDEIVFGGDVDVSLKWRLTRNFGVVAGYHLLVLDGVARANAAMDFSKSVSGAIQARHETDQLVVHTVYAGLTLDL